MADSSEIDAAVITMLSGDATLTAVATGGVFFGEAPQNSDRFVTVSLVTSHDEPKFGGRAYEEVFYDIQYVERSTSGTNAKAAAKRIDELIELQTLSATGFAPMLMRRDERIRYAEVDDVDKSIRWQHRGGRYQVMVAPLTDPNAGAAWTQPGWMQP